MATPPPPAYDFKGLCYELQTLRLPELKVFYDMFLNRRSYARKHIGLAALTNVLETHRSIVETVLRESLTREISGLMKEIHSAIQISKNLCQRCMYCTLPMCSLFGVERCINCIAREQVTLTLDITDVKAFAITDLKFTLKTKKMTEDSIVMFFQPNIQPINTSELFKEWFNNLTINNTAYMHDGNTLAGRSVTRPFDLKKNEVSIISLRLKKPCIMFWISIVPKDTAFLFEMISSQYVDPPQATTFDEDDNDVQIMQSVVVPQVTATSVDHDDDDDGPKCPFSGLKMEHPVKSTFCMHPYVEAESLFCHFTYRKTHKTPCVIPGCNAIYGVDDLHYDPNHVAFQALLNDLSRGLF